jgi:hypothetical protein
VYISANQLPLGYVPAPQGKPVYPPLSNFQISSVMATALVQLLCPACGHAFLNATQHELAAQVCPRCAFNGATSLFDKSPTKTAGLVVKRGESHRFGPTMGTQTGPTRLGSTKSAATKEPTAWHIREFPAIKPATQSAAHAPRPTGPIRANNIHAEPDAHWQERQALVQNPIGPLPAKVEPEARAQTSADSPSTTMDLSSLKSGVQSALATWPGMGPDIEHGDASDFLGKPRRRTGFWVALALAIGVIGALLAAIFNEATRSTAITQSFTRAENSTPTTPLPSTIIKSAIPLSREPSHSRSKTARAVVKDIEATGTRLITTLFAAKTSNERIECISEGARYRSSVDKFFSKLKSPITVTSFKPLGTPVKALPGNEVMTLCEVTTNYPASGTAITRLLAEADGIPRLDWPMLRDSLQSVLAIYARKPGIEPQWVSVGMRRNFGFNESEAVRKDYLVFDIQGTGNGNDRTIAIVSKSSPTGRAFDKVIPWNELYIVRTLLNWSEVEGKPRLTVLDAELVPTDGESQ